MTLGFTQKINGKPNYFIPKIWKSFLKGVLMNANEFTEKFKALSDEYQRKINDVKPKLHTIRADTSNRWKAGMDIHMVINNRTKNRFQFAPLVKCVSVQKIEIEWTDSGTLLGREARVYIDETKQIGKYSEKEKYYLDVPGRSLQELAINDGFDSVEDFFAYFNKDFKGKIIHWTDLKY